MMREVHSSSEPCSGGWPNLNSRRWEDENLPGFSVHASWYSGFDVQPLLSAWVVAPNGERLSLDVDEDCHFANIESEVLLAWDKWESLHNLGYYAE